MRFCSNDPRLLNLIEHICTVGCRTVSGANNGALCVLPFTHKVNNGASCVLPVTPNINDGVLCILPFTHVVNNGA